MTTDSARDQAPKFATDWALTPRQTDGVPQRLGGFSTIADALDYAAKGETGFNFYGSSKDRGVSHTWM